MNERKELPTVSGEGAEERCETCLFWKRHNIPEESEDQVTPEDTGTCLRYPPVYIGESDEVDMESWCQPYSMEDDWCGEWKARKATKENANQSGSQAIAVPFAELIVSLGSRGGVLARVIRENGICDWDTLLSTKFDPIKWRNFGETSMKALLTFLAQNNIEAPSHWTMSNYLRRNFINGGGKFFRSE